MSIFAPLHAACQFIFPRAMPPGARDEQAVERIHQAAALARPWTDEQLRAQVQAARLAVRGNNGDKSNHRSNTQSQERRQRDNWTYPPGFVSDVFAVLVEALRRVRGLTLYDVQLLAGLALARGAVVEMATGEGKTLAAALPAALWALAGCGVHIVTPNEYLAGRDYAELAPVFRLLGISVGLVRDGAPPAEKRLAYACDVTYATGYELGFDYLRDQLPLVGQRAELGRDYLRQLRGQTGPHAATVQRGQAVAIIDEIDSVLLDEACLPLILSDGAAARPDPAPYERAAKVARALAAGDDYRVEMQQRTVRLTEQGVALAHARLPDDVEAQLKRPWQKYVEQALVADWLRQRDIDYVVRQGKVQLVDFFTGRIFPDRTWCDGLQQAIEVKEGLAVQPELLTSARISRQRYFSRYAMICGMSGTLQGSEGEFRRQYGLPVVVVPLNRPCRRRLLPGRYFAHADAKWRAVVDEVLAVHVTRRPILAGTRTIEASRILAQRLDAAGIPYRLLNGAQDEDEAHVVAQAGQAGAVTIATNMAGRGTDIRLGPGVAELGGLHVVGTEHHESARVDRQLLGRAGRQGDPGSGRFFAAIDDALFRRYATDLVRQTRTATDTAGEIHSELAAVVADAQRRAERADYVQRRRLFAHDRWLEEWLCKGGSG